MTDITDDGRRRSSAAESSGPSPTALRPIGQWATGTKLFLILSIALLPLALIAIFATLRTSQMAGEANRARLRIAASEAARTIAIELNGDTTALRAAANALAADPYNSPACARLRGIFALQRASGVRYVVADRKGEVLCGNAFSGAPAAMRRVREENGDNEALLIPQGVVLATQSIDDRVMAAAFFPAAFLAKIGRPGAFDTDYGATLIRNRARLPIDPLTNTGGLNRRQTAVLPLNVAGLTYEMQVHSAPITSPLVIALLFPILMWAAAAGISWLVFDRLLVRPLRMLRSSVAAYTPGEELGLLPTRMIPAQEIRELGDTFRAISRTVAIHEAGLAEGLIRQTKLTREVHHRVKNNLQVIASLINLHARGARSDEAAAAYTSIQRRVDALAVVHRNHFAEMEENRGLGLRGVLGELASNLRATAPETARPSIVLDIEPYFVTQDTAVAVTFLVTELIELGLTCEPMTQFRISLKSATEAGRAMLRISSPALIESDCLAAALSSRYGRVIEGLARQLRAAMHHEALVGAYEISITVVGRE